MHDIKARANRIDNVSLAGRELEMQPVLVCAELDKDGTMKSSPGAVVKAELFEVVQTTAANVQIISDIAAWLGVLAADACKYVLNISLRRNDLGDMGSTDHVQVYVGVVGTKAQSIALYPQSTAFIPVPIAMFPQSNMNEINVNSVNWAVAESHGYFIYVEAISQPKGV